MRVLALGPSNSPHTLRNLGLLADRGIDVHLYSPVHAPVFPGPARVTIHLEADRPTGDLPGSVTAEPLEPELAGGLHPHERPAALAALIERLQPDLILSQVHQLSGYLVLAARRLLAERERSGTFPVWVVHDWGTDVSLFHSEPRHRRILTAMFAACDGLLTETVRDVALSRSLGFDGAIGPVVPVTGGYELEELEPLRTPGPASARKAISVKGRTSGRYRAGMILDSLEQLGDRLAGFELQAFLAEPEFEERARGLCERTGMALRVARLGEPLPHPELMALHGRSRISISASVGDGICTSLIDAMAMGAFPIQSADAAGREWGVDGRDSILFSLDRPADLTAAIERALGDDELVDRAAERNIREAGFRLERGPIVDAWADFILEMAEGGGSGHLAGRREALAAIAGNRGSGGPDRAALSRRRRELLEAAYLSGRGGTSVPAGELGIEEAGEQGRRRLIEDLVWGLGRQFDQLEAVASVVDPPIPSEYAATLERDEVWVTDANRHAALREAATDELASVRSERVVLEKVIELLSTRREQFAGLLEGRRR